MTRDAVVRVAAHAAVFSVVMVVALVFVPPLTPPGGRHQAPVVASRPRTPVEANGRLHVCGTQLCNQAGTPVQLRGLSSDGTQRRPHCLSDAAFRVLARDWKSSVVRVSTYVSEGGYVTNPRRFTALANQLVDRASAHGLYVIVDWHINEEGDPNRDLDQARTFFRQIAERHRHRTNVIYEIANEPSRVSWPRIKAYADKMIPMIRAIDPRSVILVGTRSWSTLGVTDGGNEQEVVKNPVRASNIMYTFHFYAQTHRDNYLSTLRRASSRLPIFVTEWGAQSWMGYGNDFPMSQKFVDLMTRKKISWTYWSISDDEREGSVFTQGACYGGKFTGKGALKPAGLWIRERVRRTA